MSMKRKLLILLTIILTDVVSINASGIDKVWKTIPIKQTKEEIQENDGELTTIQKRILARLSKKGDRERTGTSQKVNNGESSSTATTGQPNDSQDYSNITGSNYEQWEIIGGNVERKVTKDPAYGNSRIVKGDNEDIENIIKMAKSIIEPARQYRMVRPYNPYILYPNNSGSGIDCSGMVHFAYKYGANIELIYMNTRDFLGYLGMEVTQGDMIPGDILLFSAWDSTRVGAVKHTGIYLGNNNYIHIGSNSGGKGIRIDTLKGDVGSLYQYSGGKGRLKSVKRVIMK